MKKTRTSEKPDPTKFLKIKISPIKLYNTTWPAKIFAYNRSINEKGLINIPNNSIGARSGLKITGTPGIQKICFQYVLFAVMFVIKKVIKAKQNVTAIFPVTLTPRGVSPNKFKNQTKKKRVRRKLM